MVVNLRTANYHLAGRLRTLLLNLLELREVV